MYRLDIYRALLLRTIYMNKTLLNSSCLYRLLILSSFNFRSVVREKKKRKKKGKNPLKVFHSLESFVTGRHSAFDITPHQGDNLREDLFNVNQTCERSSSDVSQNKRGKSGSSR